MAVVLGTSSGFVIVAPTADPAGTDTVIDGASVVTKHTSPGGAVKITEIGWYRGSGTNAANFEIALYSEVSGVASVRLFVDATNSSTSAGWIVTAVDWAISENTAYWLAVQMDAHTGSSNIDTNTSGGAGIDRRTSQTTLNDPYGGGAVLDADGMYAIYAKVNINASVSPGTGELTITGFAPTVTVSDPKNVSPGTGAVDVTGFAPSVVASDNKNITPGFGEVTIIGFSPAVAVTDNINITPGFGELTITGFEPTVSTPVNILPDTGSIVVIGFNPVVTATDNKNVTPGFGEVVIEGQAPTVTVTDNKNVNPGTGEITLEGFAPTVSITDNKNVQPDTGTITLTGFAPVVVTTDNKNVLPGTGELTIEGFAPVVTISTGGPVEMLPGTGQLIITGHAPTVTATVTSTTGGGKGKNKRVSNFGTVQGGWREPSKSYDKQKKDDAELLKILDVILENV